VYISLYNFVLCNLAVYFIPLLKKNKPDLTEPDPWIHHRQPNILLCCIVLMRSSRSYKKVPLSSTTRASVAWFIYEQQGFMQTLL